MKQYRVALTGITPLIMHWDNIEWQDQMLAWRTVPENAKNSKAGDDRTPPYTWKGHTYNDGEVVVVPHDNLRSNLIAAGKKVKTGKGATTFKTAIASGISFDAAFVPLVLSNGKTVPWSDIEAIEGTFVDQCEGARRLGFKLLAKRASVGQNKHVRVRPVFDKGWSLSFAVTVTDDSLTQEVLQELFRVAGRYIALCDWRVGAPKSPGPYGQYTAEVETV